MDASTLLSRLEKLRVWSRGNERAPHKPLLLLHALARIERGQERVMKFAEVKGPLEELLREFGPTRKQTHPEYPFWRLENDGIWEVEWPRTSQVRERGQSEPSAAYLLREDVAAGFTPEVQELLESEPALRRKAASVLLARCYPSTYHEDILASVGLEAEAEWESVERRVRDPGFRHRVLDAWGRRCGVCSFDVTLGTAPLALDAAHIRWKQYRGPDVEDNGIALCALHHRLFDRGAFTLVPGADQDPDLPPRLAVSEKARGDHGIRVALLDFHGQPLMGPREDRHRPAAAHLAWHRKEVFQGPQRPLDA